MAGFLCVAGGQQSQLNRAGAPPEGLIVVRAQGTQSAEGPVYHLRGNASLETRESWLGADEIDYDDETKEAVARGHVHFRGFERGEELWADSAYYNVASETGKFYNVRGTSPFQAKPRPGLLLTTNPFYFQGKWAERLKEKYLLYDGMLTNCKMPNPWWKLQAPKFDIVPADRALAYHSVFKIRGLPIFYTFVFYKSLQSQPRRSGLLTPNIGNSSRRGKMIGGGYYWAINRSLDATYRAQYFTQRGFAHTVDFRGKPRGGTDFNVYLYGVNDRGLKLPGGLRQKQGGVIVSTEGSSELGSGFHARAEVNYLSSMRFRQAFTESFNEAIFSEVHSTGFVEKHWSDYGLNFVFSRTENIQKVGDFVPAKGTFLPDDKIVIRKLPEVDFQVRDKQVWDRGLPLWFSFDSSAGLLRRDQSLFQTRQFMERLDFRPHVMTAIRWKGFSLLPGFSVSADHYGESMQQGLVIGRDINRAGREFTLELVPPSLARNFEGMHWLGDKVKHVIEPRASFRYAGGFDDFQKLVRFDETELLTNTKEVEISLTNRIYAKRGDEVHEVLSWQVSQTRYFDPTFGGAVVTGTRNVIASTTALTGFTFLDQPRNYSPVVSVFRLSPVPGFGLEWRSDYDPLRHKMVNGGLTADLHRSKYFLSLGHNYVRSVPLLSPSANQIRGLFGIGNENRRGWNGAFSAVYDFRTGVMQFATTQVTYNTDCCGISIQYRRFSFGTRNENQFRVSFAVANFGSFGTLKRQERLF